MKKGCCISLFVATLMVAFRGVAGDDFGDFAGELENEFEHSAPTPEHDPLRWINRGVFRFNDTLYLWVLEPTATGYARVAPESVRCGLSNFFKNLGFPSRAVNNLFQGKLAAAGNECSRFAVNTTVGILGFRDPAFSWLGIREAREDFGQTLAYYGVGDGIPVMLPIFGPSNLRDTAGLVVDYFLDPISYIDSFRIRMAVKGTDRVNHVSLHLGEYEKLKEGSLDPYMLFISAYKQNRDDKIKE